jgi:hypothetical protein
MTSRQAAGVARGESTIGTDSPTCYARPMSSVTALAPIATQLGRSIPLEVLFPQGSVEAILRDARQQVLESESRIPDDVEPFYGHYCAVIRTAASLLGAPAFASLSRLHEAIQEEYMPGGPPQSPVYDSFAMQFILSAVPQGIGHETPYTVLARLLLRDPSRYRLQQMAQSLADASFDLYRVKTASGHSAEIECVRGSGGALSVRLTGPFLRTGDFGLMRVLELDGKLFIADSPYLLTASEADWHEHLARIVATQQTPATATAKKDASKLSSKERARQRQKDKAKAGRSDPEHIIKRYLQLGLSERYWLNYIMDAYAGERRGIVFLAGVPDRPELLPHSAEYQGPRSENPSPWGRFRERLMRTAVSEGLLDVARREVERLVGAADPSDAEIAPNEHNLLNAYVMYGLHTEDDTTVLTRAERAFGAEPPHAEVRSFIDNLRNGWFSVMRVDRIYLDEALEVFDLLRGQKLQITERAATR